jgi:hypothetical protein
MSFMFWPPYPSEKGHSRHKIDGSTFWNQRGSTRKKNIFRDSKLRKRKSCPFWFSVSQQPHSSLGRFIVDVSRSHTIRHTHTHTHGSTPLNDWSFCRSDRYLHITQQKKQTNIHAFSGSRTRYPSDRAAAYLRLRTHGYREERLTILFN